jgi:hypothetical protein
MNFVIWILHRIKQYILGSNPFRWIKEYQELILNDKGLSVLITIFGGLMWFVLCLGLCLYFLDGRENIFFALRLCIYAVPVFYVINWLFALHKIYDLERMATWEALKRDHQEYT